MDMPTASPAPKPTGRRKITAAEFCASFPPPDGTRAAPPLTRQQVLAALWRGARALGIQPGVTRLVAYLASLTSDMDWDGVGPTPPMAWPSDNEIMFQLDLARTAVKNRVRAALDLGLIRMARSPTGRRGGSRGADGRILHAYGFDLSPLANRFAEFNQAAAIQEAERAEAQMLRKNIATLRTAILSTVDLARDEGYAGPEWQETADNAESLFRQRGRDTWHLATLVQIHAALKTLDALTTERLGALMAVDNDMSRDPAGSHSCPPFTLTNQSPRSTDLTISPVGRYRPEAKEESSDPSPIPRGGATEDSPLPRINVADRPSPLRGFPLTPQFLLQIAPALRDEVSTANPSWVQTLEAADRIRSTLGISRTLWGQACVTLGRQAAITAVVLIMVKQDSIGSPGGYLTAMVRAHLRGALPLDRSLYGLAHKVGVEAPRRSH